MVFVVLGKNILFGSESSSHVGLSSSRSPSLICGPLMVILNLSVVSQSKFSDPVLNQQISFKRFSAQERAILPQFGFEAGQQVNSCQSPRVKEEK